MSIVGVKIVREVSTEQYAEAYKKYRACLYKSSKNWISKLGEDEALHIAGIALWRALQSYDESRRRRSTFLGHLINCIRWSFLDNYKQIQKQKEKEDSGDAINNIESEPSFCHAEADERPSAIKPHLNFKAGQIVDLVVAGKNSTEISKEMNLSRQRIHQIFGDIRETYNRLANAGKI